MAQAVTRASRFSCSCQQPVIEEHLEYCDLIAVCPTDSLIDCRVLVMRLNLNSFQIFAGAKTTVQFDNA